MIFINRTRKPSVKAAAEYANGYDINIWDAVSRKLATAYEDLVAVYEEVLR